MYGDTAWTEPEDKSDKQQAMRQMYEAARRHGQSSAEGRTFEQWKAAVSDFGLAAARDALLSDKAAELSRLKEEVVEAAREQGRLKRGPITCDEGLNYIPLLHAAMIRLNTAVDDLEAYERKQGGE